MELEKQFKCSECDAKFIIAEHFQAHCRRHEMSLNLTKSTLSGASSLSTPAPLSKGSLSAGVIGFPDETPTPTRFIRNCEEVGLFQDLQNVNPFDEDFRKAASNTTPSGDGAEFEFTFSSSVVEVPGTPNVDHIYSARTSRSKRRYSEQDTLNTPQVFSFFSSTGAHTLTTNTASMSACLTPTPQGALNENLSGGLHPTTSSSSEFANNVSTTSYNHEEHVSIITYTSAISQQASHSKNDVAGGATPVDLIELESPKTESESKSKKSSSSGSVIALNQDKRVSSLKIRSKTNLKLNLKHVSISKEKSYTLCEKAINANNERQLRNESPQEILSGGELGSKKEILERNRAAAHRSRERRLEKKRKEKNWKLHFSAYTPCEDKGVSLSGFELKVEVPHVNNGDGPEKKVTRLAIGVDGGFDATQTEVQYDIKDTYSVVLLPGFIKIAMPNEHLPQQVLDSVAAVIAAESAAKMAEAEALAGTWDGEIRQISKHSDTLQQLDNGKKIPPKGWRCEADGCSKTENLWMNLTDGTILCGRRYADGSGGNNHAVEHYNIAKFPLAVKLGTITPDGKADVYSYEEDDMVLDSNLVKHLGHFGINVAQMEKTEKTMIEMEIELNQRSYSEISALTEAGTKLRPLCGPGLTGLTNLGNSCYLNSVVQVLYTIPNFQERFIKNGPIYIDASQDPVGDFNVQMSKLAHGLLSGKYAVKADEDARSDRQLGISPHMFKNLVGRGHPEFSTKKQQDAQEFFLHLVNVLERHSRGDVNPADCFKFLVEDKVQCDASKKVKYTQRTEYFLPLPIPMELAINKEEVKAFEKRKEEAKAQNTTVAQDDIVRPIIPFDACIQSFVEKETLEPFYSTAVQRVVTASKFTRLASFPDYLVIQLKKFTMGQDWTPQKLDVSVDMPLEIDLSLLQAKGMQAGEVVLPGEPSTPSKPKVSIDEAVVTQLMEMGFHPNACKRAVMLSGNAGAEIAMDWIMQHMDDPDLNDPINCDGSELSGEFTANPDALASIEQMGFTSAQALKALQATDNNLERAVDWIFSHAEQLDAMVENANSNSGNSSQAAQSKPANITDGSPKYKLIAFVSHMGTSSMVGHYVCHILKDNTWALFNDNRVAASENLPKDLGYLYFYKRV